MLLSIGWGVVVLLLSLICWGGQVTSWVAPRTAVRLSLMEGEESVEPAFYADERGEALWDALTLWVMAGAGLLLIAGSSVWAYFGLVGGGMYLYFAGRGLVTRVMMRRSGLRIGSPENVKVGFTFLTLWGVMAAITIVASIVALSG